MNKILEIYSKVADYFYSKKLLCFIGLCFNILMIAAPVYVITTSEVLFAVIASISYCVFNVPALLRCIKYLIDK